MSEALVAPTGLTPDPRTPAGRSRFRLLGPLSIVTPDGELGLGGRKPRELLAALLLEPNRPVSASRLIDALW